jgi:hypothetical protein
MDLSLEELQKLFRKQGATKLVAKPLAENDNSKQQIYLGGNYDVLNVLPFGEVTADTTAKLHNFKAKLELSWLTPDGNTEIASHSQLILYPSYPEVRLSGFLLGCRSAPSKYMQPIPKENRRPKNSWDGRVLFLGTTLDKKVIAYLGNEGSLVSNDFDKLRHTKDLSKNGIFYDIPLGLLLNTKQSLLNALTEIKNLGWTPSVRMNSDGVVNSYIARNAGGYTLEALLGVRPNSIAGPDFLGWEIKAFSSSSKVTLMTPEPDGGYYGENGVEAFLRKYGYLRGDDSMYFTGVHKVNERKDKTGQMLTLTGFDSQTTKITNIEGGITMLDSKGEPSAIWTYGDLITHWGKKHANAAYIPCKLRKEPTVDYQYSPPALIGIGTDFTKFLSAMDKGLVNYDPGPKLMNSSTAHPTVKARSQFRISIKNLASLYDSFEKEVF